MTGTVFNIQRFSLHDGPGIRTTVFLAGCNLRCRWCHNPEGIRAKIQLQYHNKDCIGCRVCASVCANGVHLFHDDVHSVDFSKCILCGACIHACPTGALLQSAKSMEADQLAQQICRDVPFYKQCGGVTFSGGEPLLQADFVAETAQICKKKGAPTIAVDTAGNLPWEVFEKVLPWTDYFLFDIKAGTEQTHILGTGQSNKRILSNLRKLDSIGKNLYIRIPVIPSVNDCVEEMDAIAQILRQLHNVQEIRLIPYHTFGREKYATIGYNEPENFGAVDEEKIKLFSKKFILSKRES